MTFASPLKYIKTNAPVADKSFHCISQNVKLIDSVAKKRRRTMLALFCLTEYALFCLTQHFCFVFTSSFSLHPADTCFSAETRKTPCIVPFPLLPPSLSHPPSKRGILSGSERNGKIG